MRGKILSLVLVLLGVLAIIPTTVNADTVPGLVALVHVKTADDENLMQYTNVMLRSDDTFDGFTFDFRNWEMTLTEDLEYLNLYFPGPGSKYENHKYSLNLNGERVVNEFSYTSYNADNPIYVIGSGTLKIKLNSDNQGEEVERLKSYFDLGTYYTATEEEGYLVISGSSDRIAEDIPLYTNSLFTDDISSGYLYSSKELDETVHVFKVEDLTSTISEEVKNSIQISSNGGEVLGIYDLSVYNVKTDETVPMENGEFTVSIRVGSDIVNNKDNLTVAYIEDGVVKETFPYEVYMDDLGVNRIKFTTTHFSQYAILNGGELIGVNNSNETSNINNPETADSIVLLASLLTVSLIGIGLSVYKINKRRHS